MNQVQESCCCKDCGTDTKSTCRAISTHVTPLRPSIRGIVFLGLAGLVGASDVVAEGNSTAAESKDACAISSLDNYSLSFHIAGVFILFAVAALGIIATMQLASADIQNQKAASVLARLLHLLKMFGIGVIAATAWIHLLPDAFGSFGNPCLDAGWARYGTGYVGVFGLIAAFITQLIEMAASGYNRGCHAKSLTDNSSVCAGHDVDNDGAELVRSPSGPIHSSDHDKDLSPDQTTVLVLVEQSTDSHEKNQSELPLLNSCPAIPPHDAGKVSLRDQARSHDTDSHTDVSSNDFSKEIATIILECGIMFHSLIVGVTLGVTPDDSYTTLLIAVAFHQLFEGMALGVLIGTLSMSLTSKRLLCLMYPLTTPLGVAIGITVRHSYNENGTNMILVQGIFNSLSAGILFYNSYTELMSEEVSHNAHFRGFTTGFKAACFSAMYFGAASMAILAIWA
ncbi:Zinc/iron permease [Chytriomyces cf. hyalinus JEL632]|nr:Zinc/iron permease [Chytriomyces cf. hyalinus JEL632]